MRRIFRLAAVVSVLVALGAVLWFSKQHSGLDNGRQGQASVAAPPPVPVTVFDARSGTIPRIIAGIGVVTALQSVTVRSRVDGEVTNIAFAEGDFVKAGDILAQIDPRQLEAALVGAQAKKTQDAALLDSANSDLDRYTALAQKNIVSTQTLDQKSAAVKQLAATITSDDAAISSARTQLSYATIRAPISGRTGFRSVDQGGLISQSSSNGLVTITQLDPIAVTFVAPGDRFGEIREALKQGIAEVEASSTDGSKVLARGKLTLLDNIVDAQNGSIRLRATFDNKSNVLWPGLPVATRLTVQRVNGAIVPDKALARETGGLTAYVIDDSKIARRRTVEVAAVTNGLAAVVKGIASGERVVFDGLGQIGDGRKVAVEPLSPDSMKPYTPFLQAMADKP